MLMLAFFVVSVLAFSVVVQSMNNNTTILLKKRSNSSYDGPIDYEKTAILIPRDFSRRANLLSNLKQKFMDKLKPPRKVVSVPLHKTKEGLFLTEILFGRNPHPFPVVVDTGTSLFWAEHRPTSWEVVQKSDTKGPYMSRHAGRPGFRGILYEEEISLAGIAGFARVMDAEELLGKWQALLYGVLGLALSPHDPEHLPAALPFVTSFLTIYASPVFALSLAPGNPVMHLNGTDAGFYTGKIEYHPITRIDQSKGSQPWQIGGANIYVNGHKDVAAGVETIFDTGTWGMSGPPDQVEEVYKLIRGSEQLPEGYDFFPCYRPHALAVRWNKKKIWNIDPENFNISQPDLSKEICEGVLKKDPQSRNIWTLGGSALTKWYLAFDATLKKPRAGLAELKTPVHQPAHQAPAYQPPAYQPPAHQHQG